MITFSNQVAGLFTTDAEVIEIIVDTLPYLAVFVIIDGVHGV